MGFKDNMKSDMEHVFLNTDEFAEDIIYLADGVTEKIIKAVVNRRRSLPANEDNARINVHDFEITISKSAANGIPVVKKAKDKVRMTQNIGGPAAEFIVADILEFDEATYKLLIRR